jgi:bifunctional DNA-binding transcriptional regulator/antitoxin component of YhaV-PrlF toxin-antitoxin module
MPENTSIDTNPNVTYTVTLDEDGEDLILPVPDEILNQLGWKDGSMLEWDINKEDNTIIIRKIEDE